MQTCKHANTQIHTNTRIDTESHGLTTTKKQKHEDIYAYSPRHTNIYIPIHSHMHAHEHTRKRRTKRNDEHEMYKVQDR